MSSRWLLPFTHGVDVHALEQVLRAAQVCGAMLVPVSLISVAHGKRSGVRLEHIQQSKDFLVLVQRKAARYQVSLECHEVFTVDMRRCITLLVQELCCDSLVLAPREQQGALLPTQEVASLLIEPPAALVLIRPSGQKPYLPTARPVVRLLSQLRKLLRHQEEGRYEEKIVADPGQAE